MSFVVSDRVKETSTSTGTGAFTLAGAVVGHKTFASRCVLKDRCHYCIQAIDASGAPSGEWETGIGVYSAANTLTRHEVFESSNADALVSFGAGTKHVFITLPADQFKGESEALPYSTLFREYFVRKDGSDTNDGLSNTAGGAFLTIQKALEQASWVMAGIVTINVGAGTYSEFLSFPNQRTNRYVYLVGDAETPSNVVINSTVTSCAFMSGNALIDGFRLVSASNALWIDGANGPGLNNLRNLVFGGAGTGADHIRLVGQAKAYFSGTITVSAAAASFLALEGQSRADLEIDSLVISGTPDFSGAFITAKELSLVKIPDTLTTTITGTATGKRYDVRHSSVLLNMQSLTLPGGTAGTTATGGQYTTT